MKKKLLIGVISVTVIALFVILFSINNFRGNLEKRYVSDIYSRLSELSDNNANSINSKIQDQFEIMHTLATYLSHKDLKSEETLSIMKKTVKSYSFLRCAITFPDGSFITHDSKNSGNTSKDEFVIRGFKGASTVTGPRIAVVDPTKTVILITVPIYQDGKIIALLTCTYETKYLENVFQMTSFNGKGYSYITDVDGNVISKPNKDNLIYNGDNIIRFFEKQHKNIYYKMKKDIHAMKSGTLSFTVNGEQKYVSYQPLGINEWYVFSITSGEVIQEQLNSMLNSVYSLAFIIILTLMLLMFFAWVYIDHVQQKSKKQLEKLAYYDSLTEIPNQNLFEKEARHILNTRPGDYAYIILNVNKFKIVNDLFGFSRGDKLLQHIAKAISEETGKVEISARFDADNFHILSVYSGKEELEKRMLAVADRIDKFHFDKEVSHKLSVGFGVYLIEDKEIPIGQMGDKARMALSKIKGIHSHTTYFYNDDIISKFIADQEIENTMQDALLDGEMKLYFQPKCSTKTHKILSAEALVRWEHPDKGIIMPDSFIPLFEKNGFILKLDMYMMETVCKKIREWQEKEIRVFPISVNQSRACLYQSGYVQKLVEILNKYNVSPSLIEVEITERAFFEDEMKLIKIIDQLHSFGFKVAMDDFGAGYSSLNMLQDVLVDVLKIDKNFFSESINSKRGKTIVRNVVSMANDLNIEVVAEGIETKEQLNFLKEIHCSSVQGYYFSKPISAKLFEDIYSNIDEENSK
ncbi:MAG: EAL domain-containing protein [Anaerovoracaceae bacterium]